MSRIPNVFSKVAGTADSVGVAKYFDRILHPSLSFPLGFVPSDFFLLVRSPVDDMSQVLNYSKWATALAFGSQCTPQLTKRRPKNDGAAAKLAGRQ